MNADSFSQDFAQVEQKKEKRAQEEKENKNCVGRNDVYDGAPFGYDYGWNDLPEEWDIGGSE